MAKINVIYKTPGKNSLPYPTFVHLCLSGYSSDEDENILLSPELATNQEVDYYVDDLVKQLEKVRRKAKKILEKNKS
jgi:hypothetical protein